MKKMPDLDDTIQQIVFWKEYKSNHRITKAMREYLASVVADHPVALDDNCMVARSILEDKFESVITLAEKKSLHRSLATFLEENPSRSSVSALSSDTISCTSGTPSLPSCMTKMDIPEDERDNCMMARSIVEDKSESLVTLAETKQTLTEEDDSRSLVSASSSDTISCTSGSVSLPSYSTTETDLVHSRSVGMQRLSHHVFSLMNRPTLRLSKIMEIKSIWDDDTELTAKTILKREHAWKLWEQKEYLQHHGAFKIYKVKHSPEVQRILFGRTAERTKQKGPLTYCLPEETSVRCADSQCLPEEAGVRYADSSCYAARRQWLHSAGLMVLLHVVAVSLQVIRIVAVVVHGLTMHCRS